MALNPKFVDKLIERVSNVRPVEVQSFLSRLSKEKGFLETIFEALEEGVIVADEAGWLRYINTSACEFFGLDKSQVIGLELSETIRGLHWNEIMKTGHDLNRDLEVFYPKHRFLNFYVRPIETEDGPAIVMLVRDVTQERRMTEEQIESERMNALTILAAGVAHELGNPLNSLGIHLQVLERKIKKNDAQTFDLVKEQLDVARSEIKRLDLIIGQFLGAIRPTRANLRMEQVNDLIEESLRFLEPELKDRNIKVELQLDINLPLHPLDAGQMKQAFYNVIRNSVQAMPAKGRLMIGTEMSEFEIMMYFRDNGKGISSDHMSHLFHPFKTTKSGGNGLGLLIVRRIIREHGGELQISSRENQGTEVRLSLPRLERPVRLLESVKPIER